MDWSKYMTDDIQQRILQVSNDREHGSRWLVREAVLVLRDLAQAEIASPDEHMRRLYATARQLAGARPAMAALSSAVSHILNVRGGPEAVVQQATRLLKEYDSAPAHIAAHARPYLKSCLMTCSISGTVLEALAACHQQIEHI